MRVLVTSANMRMAHVIAKALASRGVEVIVADSVPRSFSFFSRYAKGHFLYPSPYSEQEAFVQCLLKNVESLGCDVLIPIHEETFLIAKHIDDFVGKVGLALPTYDQILAVHFKDRFFALCQNLDVPIPRSRILNWVSEAKKVSQEFRFPVVLKPRQGGGNYGIEYINKAEDFTYRYRACLEKHRLTPERLIVQEYIDVGKKFSQAFVYDNGKMVASFADIHLRDYPASGGSGTFRESTHEPQLEQLGRRVLDHLCWHGVAECEFIRERHSGKPYMIEINPRIWGGVNSAVSAGLNIPWILCCLATGLRDQIGPLVYRDSVRTRWFWADLQVFPHYFRSSQRKFRFALEFFNLLTSKVVCDDFDPKDPLPFFVWPMKKIWKVIRHRAWNPPSYGIQGEWS